jgi:hypothetical protein
VMNPLWIQHADYLHHVPYSAFFGFGSLFLLSRYLRQGRLRTLLLSGLFLGLMYMSSYDWWFFGPLLAAAVTVGHYRAVFHRSVVRVLATLAAFAVAGILFKLATNAWGLDGVDELIKDLRFQFVERATDKITRTDYHQGAWPTLYGRVERFTTLLIFPLVVFWALFPMIKRKWGDRLPVVLRSAVNPILLLAAALPFLLIFMELWVAQYYPGMLIVPFYAVAFAALAVGLYEWGPRNLKIVAVVLVAALLANSVDENLSFETAFFEQDAVDSLRVQMARLHPPDKEVLVNHVFDGQYRFFFNRKIVGLTTTPPRVADLALISFSNPAKHPRTATEQGTIFVQHKHVVNELYDKGYYYVLGRFKLWNWWGNPRKYRRPIDELMAERDSMLMSHVARLGHKVHETDFYTIWRIPPVIDSLRPVLPPAAAPGR